MLILSLLFALVLTIFIEVIVALLMGYHKVEELLVVILASIVTNPPLNLFVWFTGLDNSSLRGLGYIIILEVVVVVIEFVILRVFLYPKRTTKQLASLAVIMNATSYLFGMGLTYLITLF